MKNIPIFLNLCLKYLIWMRENGVTTFSVFRLKFLFTNIASGEMCKYLLQLKIGAKYFKLLTDHFCPEMVVNKFYEEIVKVLSSCFEDSCYILE